MIASDLVIPISRPESRELDIVIEDGGNRPLTVEGVTLRLAPQPWICFESPDGSSLTARYGAATLAAPVYDLEAARQMLLRSTVQRARWSGPPAPDASARTSPAPLKLEGAPLARRSYRFSRHVASAPPGLAVLPLDADVLARSRQLADVRLVDSTSRQVPYVVERRAAPVVVQVQIRRHTEPKRNVSVYQLALPYPTMPDGAKLVLTTSARVFSRNVELWSGADDRRGREARQITSGSWKSTDAEEAAPPLSFDLPRNSGSVNLSIDEGDNAPLPITSAEVHIPAYALRFYSPDSRLTLLSPRLFSEPAHEVALISPPPLDTPADSTGERKFFWIAIAIVAIVLMVLVTRLLAPLVREEPRTLG
jgi:hypothetical protein